MEKTLRVDKDLADHLQFLMDLNEQVPDAKRDGVLHVFTVNFGDGIEADIKVCNGDTGPWVDAVLFDQGHEVGLLEPGATLLGEYPFEYGGQSYLARLEV